MEAACHITIPDTKIINCIWHLACQNLGKNLGSTLGDRWHAFKSRFWKIRNALTESEFEEGWKDLLRDFGSHQKMENYLCRLHERRYNWAWPWVGMHITARMQSTQRVEQTHSYVKRLASGTATLIELFDIIDQKVEMEKLARSYSKFQQNSRPSRQQNNPTRPYHVPRCYRHECT
ncbi:hypothetical protein BGZ65_000557, partial [Modicella reniformis]